MSIRMKDLVGTLSKEHEKIVAAEFDKRYPNTGILDFTIHAKSQFILRGYNMNDLNHMKKFVPLDIVPQDNMQHVVASRSIQYGIVVQRYGNRVSVITTLDRFRHKTKNNKIIVESVELEILWTR